MCCCMDEVKLFLYSIRFLTIQPIEMIIIIIIKRKITADGGWKWNEEDLFGWFAFVQATKNRMC